MSSEEDTPTNDGEAMLNELRKLGQFMNENWERVSMETLDLYIDELREVIDRAEAELRRRAQSKSGNQT